MKIVVGICGSIAAYKTFDLVRGLVKNGHEVKVILTKGALEFVKPNVFNYLGAVEVFLPHDDFENKKPNVLHIEIAKWMDHFCIYPASANTLSRLAFGMADDLLSSVFLAKRDETITSVFPAMNTFMWTHPITKENIDLLSRITLARNVFIHPPSHGLLACGDVGEGKAPDVQKVINCVEAINPNIKPDAPVCIITAGATIAPIDPVRFVSNSSSGLTGFELAKESLKKGLKTIVIAGIHATNKLDDLLDLPGYELIRVKTTKDMLAAVLTHFDKCSFYISSAAVSDLEFEVSESKLKKDSLMGSQANALAYKLAPDILAEVLKLKSKNQKIIGFAAETNLDFQTLEKKWKSKPVDLLVGTLVNNGLTDNGELLGFNKSSASYKFFKNGKIVKEETMPKANLPAKIFTELLND